MSGPRLDSESDATKNGPESSGKRSMSDDTPVQRDEERVGRYGVQDKSRVYGKPAHLDTTGTPTWTDGRVQEGVWIEANAGKVN